MFPELFKVLAAMALFVLHCSALGGALLPSALRARSMEWGGNGCLKWFFALCLGILVNIAMLFALGMAGYLSKPAVLAVALAAVVAALPRLHWQFHAPPHSPIPSVTPSSNPNSPDPGLKATRIATWVALALLFFLSVVVAFHPPGHWDDTMYQLPLARGYVQHQAIVLNEYLRFPLFPQNVNLLFALGLMFGGDVLAQAFSSLPIFVMGLGLIGVSIRLLASPNVGILAAAGLFMIGPIKRTLGYAYIDNGLGMFCWAAIVAMMLWSKEDQARRSWHWVILAGLMAGGAAGSKYFGVVLAAILGAYLLLARRDWKACLVYGCSVLAAGCWWYVRSFVISGDPIHPAGGGLFGYYLWDAGDLLLQTQEQAMHGASHNPLYIWAALKDAHVTVWALALLGLLLSKVPKPIRVLQAVFVAYFLFWFYVTQVWRYLAPVYAVATFLSCYTLYRWYAWASRFFKRIHPDAARAKALTAALLTVLLAVYAVDRFQAYKGQMENWDSILEQDPGYRLFQAANAHIPELGPKLVQLGFEYDVYFFNGTVIGDWFGPGRYRNLLDCVGTKCQPIGPAAMSRYMEKAGSRMLAVSTKEYPEFDASTYKGEFTVLAELPGGVLLKR